MYAHFTEKAPDELLSVSVCEGAKTAAGNRTARENSRATRHHTEGDGEEEALSAVDRMPREAV